MSENEYRGIVLVFFTLLWCISHSFLTSHLVLHNGSRLYDLWTADPVNTTFSVYFFNYTNVERYQKGLDPKLKLEEVGPYSYTVVSTKVDVVFNDDGTVSYRDRKIYHFAPDLSKGHPTDVIITPNIPYFTGLLNARNENLMMRFMLEKFLETLVNEKLFYKIRVEKILWGYKDALLQMAALNPNYAEKLLYNFPDGRFGLFNKLNGTQPNVATIYTGEKDISKKGLIANYNGETSLTHWRTYECNSLEAFAGSALPPYLNKTIFLYSYEACRRVMMTKTSSRVVHGVLASRYELPDDFYSNSGANSCYCSAGDTCAPDGVLDISACAYGGPLFSSKPHFLDGGSALSKLLEGLQPDKEKHKSYLDIEPNMGIILDGKTTVQLNVQLRRAMIMSSKYPDRLILPVLWISLAVNDMPSELLWEIRTSVAVFTISQAFLYYGLPVVSTFGVAALMLL